ncbi:MAG TPA: hypothetical protein VMU36_10330 [Spirochaetia bacterium]|nr:hypothetical protein [Spirochaetia bacterium]
MKRNAILIIVGLLTLSTTAFAKDSGIAIGAEAASTDFNGWGGRFVFHIPRVPLYFGVGAILNPDNTAVDFTVDYWFNRGNLSGMLDYYVGLGGYLALASASNQLSFDLGARLPIGLQIWPLRGGVLEIFLEIAPAWIPISSSALSALTFQVQPAIGFRIWF